MAEPISRAFAAVKDYAGLVLNAGPAAADPSAGESRELVNLTPLRPGELAARGGYRPVAFDDEG
jgi:hypothetical protein